MFMFKSREAGFVDKDENELNQCYLNQWYPGQVSGVTRHQSPKQSPTCLQSMVEAVLVILAVICVPIMLLGKPIYLYLKIKKAKKARGDHMSGRINMQSDEADVYDNGSNGVTHKGGIAGAHEHGEHSGAAPAAGGGHHDEVSQRFRETCR